jgi:hypothetical protein
MKAIEFPSSWSFQARVLVPVVVVIMLVVAVTISTLNIHVAAQFEAEAAQEKARQAIAAPRDVDPANERQHELHCGA